MDERERKTLIEEKKEELKKLRRELKELQDDNSLSAMVDNGMHYYCGKHIVDGGHYGKAWEALRLFVMRLYCEKFMSRRLCWKNMTHEQHLMCAKAAAEILPVWNKYYDEIYGKEAE